MHRPPACPAITASEGGAARDKHAIEQVAAESLLSVAALGLRLVIVPSSEALVKTACNCRASGGSQRTGYSAAAEWLLPSAA